MGYLGSAWTVIPGSCGDKIFNFNVSSHCWRKALRRQVLPQKTPHFKPDRQRRVTHFFHNTSFHSKKKRDFGTTFAPLEKRCFKRDGECTQH